MSIFNWDNGRCLRDHDVNDPKNVGYSIRYDDNGNPVDKRRYCLVCHKMTNNRYRRRNDNTPTPNRIYFPPRTCQFCGEEYYKLPSDKSSLLVWKHRKFCTVGCRNASYAKKKRVAQCGEAVPQPNDQITLAYLRRIVGYDPSKDYDRLDRESAVA